VDLASTGRAWRASCRQRCTTLALMPCDIATLATDAPEASHSAITCACSSALYRRLDPVPKAALSPVIVSTYSYVDTILQAPMLKIKMGLPDANLALGPRGGSGHHPPRRPSANPAASAQLKR
jgi:hypothetical protein